MPVGLVTRLDGSFAARARSGAVLDAAMAVTVLAGSLLLLSHGGLGGLRPGPGADRVAAGSESLDLVSVALVAVSSLPLIAWRTRPLGVLLVTTKASIVLVLLGYGFDMALGPPVALYLLALSRELRSASARRTSVDVLVAFVAYMGVVAVADPTAAWPAFLHNALGWAAAWFAGGRTRLRREYVAELRRRAERSDHEAESERRLAAAEERARIARDLHDSAGHAISVIAVRAGAARLRHEQHPELSLPALEAIENLARQTADEIDHIVGTLRDGSTCGEVEAPPGFASVASLIAHQEAAGLRITLDTSGPPPSRGGATDQATYRILQEALTNAARHGNGHAHVELTFRDDEARLVVTNPVADSCAPRPGGGHGLVGMRERAAMVGGHLDVEHHVDTFRLRATLPTGSSRP
jgi:signal transduction histidine kinase